MLFRSVLLFQHYPERSAVLVLKSFIVCVSIWFFKAFYTKRFMMIYSSILSIQKERKKYVCFKFFCYLGVFYYFNTILNPVLYSVMSKRFRRGFSDIRRGTIFCSTQPRNRNFNNVFTSGLGQFKKIFLRSKIKCLTLYFFGLLSFHGY